MLGSEHVLGTCGSNISQPLSYLSLMSVTISAVTWFSYDKSRDMMENQIAESTGRAFEQANQFISYKLNNVKDVSSMLVMNKELEQILRKRPSPYPLAEQIDDYNRSLDIIRSAQNSREIYSIRLFVNHTGIFSKEKSTIFSMGEFRDTDWFPRVLEQSGGFTVARPICTTTGTKGRRSR